MFNFGNRNYINTRTILGIVLIVLIGAIAWFKFNENRPEIDEVYLTNLTSNSSTIVWTTTNKVRGSVLLSHSDDFDSENAIEFFDDRDVLEVDMGVYEVVDKNVERFTHHVTIRYLSPNTEYYIAIRHGNQIRKIDLLNSFKTTNVVTQIKEPDPVYGKVSNVDQQPFDEGVVLFNRQNAENISQYMSSIISSEGTYSFDIQNLLLEDLSDGFVGDDSDTQVITFWVADDYISSETLSVLPKFDQPVPSIIIESDDVDLGTNYIQTAFARIARDDESVPQGSTGRTTPKQTPTPTKKNNNPCAGKTGEALRLCQTGSVPTQSADPCDGKTGEALRLCQTGAIPTGPQPSNSCKGSCMTGKSCNILKREGADGVCPQNMVCCSSTEFTVCSNAEKKCLGSSVGTCKADGSGFDYKYCEHGCNESKKECNSNPPDECKPSDYPSGQAICEGLYSISCQKVDGRYLKVRTLSIKCGDDVDECEGGLCNHIFNSNLCDYSCDKSKGETCQKIESDGQGARFQCKIKFSGYPWNDEKERCIATCNEKQKCQEIPGTEVGYTCVLSEVVNFDSITCDGVCSSDEECIKIDYGYTCQKMEKTDEWIPDACKGLKDEGLANCIIAQERLGKLCSPHSQKCLGSSLAICNENGNGYTYEYCQNGCNEEDAACIDGSIESCYGLTGDALKNCMYNEERQINVCIPDTKKCIGDSLGTCNEHGTSYNLVSCEYGCDDNRCKLQACLKNGCNDIDSISSCVFAKLEDGEFNGTKYCNENLQNSCLNWSDCFPIPWSHNSSIPENADKIETRCENRYDGSTLYGFEITFKNGVKTTEKRLSTLCSGLVSEVGGSVKTCENEYDTTLQRVVSYDVETFTDAEGNKTKLKKERDNPCPTEDIHGSSNSSSVKPELSSNDQNCTTLGATRCSNAQVENCAKVQEKDALKLKWVSAKLSCSNRKCIEATSQCIKNSKGEYTEWICSDGGYMYDSGEGCYTPELLNTSRECNQTNVDTVCGAYCSRAGFSSNPKCRDGKCVCASASNDTCASDKWKVGVCNCNGNDCERVLECEGTNVYKTIACQKCKDYSSCKSYCEGLGSNGGRCKGNAECECSNSDYNCSTRWVEWGECIGGSIKQICEYSDVYKFVTCSGPDDPQDNSLGGNDGQQDVVEVVVTIQVPQEVQNYISENEEILKNTHCNNSSINGGFCVVGANGSVGIQCNEDGSYKYTTCDLFNCSLNILTDKLTCDTSEFNDRTSKSPRVAGQSIEELVIPSTGKYTVQTGETFQSIVVDENSKVVFYQDSNMSGDFDGNDKILENYELAEFNVTIQKVADVLTYNFTNGWNAISIPMVMDGEETSQIRTADDLLKFINYKGLEATNISAYRNGKFLVYSLRLDLDGNFVSFGENFNLLPGEGYFVRSWDSGSINLIGNKIQESIPININPGWNLVGIYNQNISSYEGFELLRKMINGGVAVNILSKWESGRYENIVFVDGVEYGNNFNIYPIRAYWIQSKDDGAKTYRPE